MVHSQQFPYLQACSRLQDNDWAQLGLPSLLKAAGERVMLQPQSKVLVCSQIPACNLPGQHTAALYPHHGRLQVACYQTTHL